MAEKVGRFEIQEKLGESAVGAVYRALDPSLGRSVAVKTLVLPPDMPQESRDQMAREARLVGALSHPNIVPVYDVGIEESLAYIAAEFVEGQSFAALIADAAPFRPAAVLPWLDQIADALDYAHRRGVVHRDITPSNILLTRVGQIKIADFGLARLALLATAGRNVALGTPSYLSPEQVRGDAPDSRSDIFSLGTVVFELLTAKRPFDGGSLVSTVYKVVNQALPAASGLVAGLDPKVDEVLGKALDKTAEGRYPNCREFVEALRAVAQSSVLPSAPLAGAGPVGGTRFCDQCGTSLRPSVRFCYRCGAETLPPEIAELAVPEEPEATVVRSSPQPVAFAPQASGWDVGATPTPDASLPTVVAPPLADAVPGYDEDEGLQPAQALDEEPVVLREVAPIPPTEATPVPRGPSPAFDDASNPAPLSGYAVSTGTRSLPPPGADVSAPPSRNASLSPFILPLLALLALVVIAGFIGYWAAPRFVGHKRVPASQAPAPTDAPGPAPASAPLPTGPYAAAYLPTETKATTDAELALGAPDGKFARIAPKGILTVGFGPNLVATDDGTTAPDLKVTGSGDSASYTIAARRKDGDYQVIDKFTKFGSHDLHHHELADTAAVKIINTGTTDILLDSVEATRPLVPRP